LTNLLKPYHKEKDLEEINNVLFSNFSNLSDLKTEIARLKVNDLITQISFHKKELDREINNLKNELSRAEGYLLVKLLREYQKILLNKNHNLTELEELKTVLQGKLSEKKLNNILKKQQELNVLEKHLEKLQATQLEAKIELQN
jgi:hypothetical protein